MDDVIPDDLLSELVKSSRDPTKAHACVIPYIASIVTRAENTIDNVNDLDIGLDQNVGDDQREENVRALIQCLRILRNCCAGGPEVQTRLHDAGALQLLERTIKAIGSGKMGLNWDLPAVTAQLMANMSSRYAEKLWELLFPESLLILAHTDSQPTQSATSLSLLQMCIKKEGASMHLTGPRGSPIIAALLHGNKRSLDKCGEGKGSLINENIGLLCSYLAFECDALDRMMLYLGLPDIPCESDGVLEMGLHINDSRKRQLWSSLVVANSCVAQILLLEELCRETQCVSTFQCEENEIIKDVQDEDVRFHDSLAFLIDLMKLLAALPEYKVKCFEKAKHFGGNGDYDHRNANNIGKKDVIECKRTDKQVLNMSGKSEGLLQVILHFMRDIAGRDDGGKALSGGSCLVNELISLEVIEDILAALKALGPIVNPRIKSSYRVPEMEKAPELALRSKAFCRSQPYEGYRTDLVSIIANASHLRPQVQQRVTECGGLELILAQCQVDEKSPLVREWALWAVRNLCEGSEQARDAISELRASAALDSEELQKAGVKVSIDESTGKLKIAPREKS